MPRPPSFGYPLQAAGLGVINSTMQLAQAFGARLPPEQNAAVVGFVNAFWVLAMAYVAYKRTGNGEPAT